MRNFGDRPAIAVACKFEQPFKGLGGSQDMTALPLFRRIELLAPGREIRTLLDSSAAYFKRREPTKLAATLSWRGEDGERFERHVVHDLRIYRDVAFVQKTSVE